MTEETKKSEENTEHRAKLLVIRVSEDEKKRIESQAKKTGLTVSEYGRQMMMNGVAIVPQKEAKEQSENSNAPIDRRTLWGLASNLNQLTKYAHQTGVMPDIKNLLDEIQKVMAKW